MQLGGPSLDAPVVVDGRSTWLLREIGERFVGLYFAQGDEPPPAATGHMASAAIPVATRTIRTAAARSQPGDIVDQHGFVQRHYDARPGSYVLLRPDQHLTARWRAFDVARIEQARDRACARN
jgi:3-(3-hydroxy-phenyl)propionate hydroxylase